MSARRPAVVLLVLCAALLLAPALIAGSAPDVPCSTELLPGGANLQSIGFDPAVRLAGPDTSTAGASTARASSAAAAVRESLGVAGQPAQDWEQLGSVSSRVRIPAGQRYLVRFHPATGQLIETRPDDTLTAVARQAVDRAPDWVADALADNLGRLAADDQDTFARLVLDAADPLVDEIAFQVARLGSGSLTDPRFRPEVILTNATLMYEHDKVLQYVEIVDYGSAAAGGDYYSTTRYRVSTPEDPSTAQWVEIPRDVYYWYVVHPKLSDETVKDSTETDLRQKTYGYFWREYLFANPDPDHDYTKKAGGGAYPQLATVLQQPTVLWDGQAVDLPGGRPFAAGDGALDVVGNWVSTLLPEKAEGNRPVQPNQIAYEHNGNCGEIQDLLGAASRTALIPNVLTSNHCEDHVWNEIYSAAPTLAWFPYQVDWAQGPTRINRDNVAYDKDRGGGKDDSGIWAWRSDGLAYDVVDRYSKAASLVIQVVDRGGQPVDGASVLIYSEAWSGTGFNLATFGHTDNAGTSRFRVGDLQNYYLRVTSSLGNFPPVANQITKIVSTSEADRTYEYTAKLAGTLRRHTNQAQTAAPGGYRLSIRFQATDEIVYGRSPFDQNLDYTDWRQPGQIDFFYYDAVNFEAYDGGGAATAYAASEDATTGEVTVSAGSGQGDRYVVLSNEDHAVNAQLVNAEVTLYRDPDMAPPAVYLPLAQKAAVLGE